MKGDFSDYPIQVAGKRFKHDFTDHDQPMSFDEIVDQELDKGMPKVHEPDQLDIDKIVSSMDRLEKSTALGTDLAGGAAPWPKVRAPIAPASSSSSSSSSLSMQMKGESIQPPVESKDIRRPFHNDLLRQATIEQENRRAVNVRDEAEAREQQDLWTIN